MKNVFKLLLLSLVLWGATVSGSARAEETMEPVTVGQEYFTRSNIWYETADKLSTANYHKGTILPKGTKVKITGLDAKKLTFLVMPENVEFSLYYDARSTMHSFDKLLSQIFSKKNEWMIKFSAQEQSAIKDGRIIPGMRKDAVLASWGYPPSKFTPLLQTTNMWTYYGRGRGRYVIYFDGDKVIRTEE